MLKFRLKGGKIAKDDLQAIVSALLLGRVAVLPTDTLYGLSAIASSSRALRQIEKIKGGPKGKPRLVLVPGIFALRRYAKLDPHQAAYIKKAQSGKRPTTFILDYKGGLAPGVAASDKSLALRLPKAGFLIKILKAVRVPLLSTSLNRSGQDPLQSLEDIENYFSKTSRPDLLLDAGRLRRRRPSRLVDLREIGRPKVLRP